MNVTELIAAVGGDDVLEVQFLDQCSIDLNWSEKKGTKVTFGTDVAITLDGLVKCGIVLWLPRDAVKAALAKAKGETP